MPEEFLTRDPDDQSAGDSALEQATENVRRAMDVMQRVTQGITLPQEVALKQEAADLSLEQSAAAVAEAAANLSVTVTALSQTLSDTSFDKTADKAALKKAMTVFVRAAAELNKVSSRLRVAASASKATALLNRSFFETPSEKSLDDSQLAKTAGRLEQTASTLRGATDALSESGTAVDSNSPPHNPTLPMPADDIALKEE